MMTPDSSPIRRTASKVATRCGIDCCKEVAVGIGEGALFEGLIDDGQEISDDGTEDDMPEIGDSDSSDDKDTEVLHKKVWIRLAGHQGQKEEEETGQGGRATDCRGRSCCRQTYQRTH